MGYRATRRVPREGGARCRRPIPIIVSDLGYPEVAHKGNATGLLR